MKQREIFSAIIVICFALFIVVKFFQFVEKREDALMSINYCTAVNDEGETVAWEC